MTVLDAYAVLAFLRGEPCADDVAALLREPTVLTAVNAAEVLDQLVRVYSRDPDDVHADLALLTDVGMQIAPVTADLALAAGRLRARHYHRKGCSVSLADCVAAAAALEAKRPLATSGAALAAMLRAEDAELFRPADSRGVKP